MTARFAKDQLKSFIERVERLEEEKKALSDDIRDVYAEAKGNGFDVKALREIVRRRKMDTQERQEHEAILDTYMMALGMIPESSSMVAQEAADAGLISQTAADETAAMDAAVKKRFGQGHSYERACAAANDDTISTSAQPVLASLPPEESERPIAPGCVEPPPAPSSAGDERPCPDKARNPDTPGRAEDYGELPPFLKRSPDNIAPFMRVPPKPNTGEPRAPPS